MNAIILAAGYGMRMVPINTEIPKGLLEINGDVLIERTIRQLHEVGIREIYVVVGYLKEMYDYLVGKYNVTLIVNDDYANKNNIYSLFLAQAYISDTYIIPCDVWCNENPYSKIELFSWYMVSDLVDDKSWVRINRKNEFTLVSRRKAGNAMIGIAFLSRDTAELVKKRIVELCKNKKNLKRFWECALLVSRHMVLKAKVVHSSNIFEINTYEQLRDMDEKSNQLRSESISVICKTFNIASKEIVNISVLKKGMTNRSFIFTVHNDRYIMRIPGIGANTLINRKEEADIYKAIGDKNISDEIIYMDSCNGYKITKYLTNARVCDSNDENDIKKCMEKLKYLHSLNLSVKHEFNLFKQIDFYESVWDKTQSRYKDYLETKKKIMSLKAYVDSHIEHKCLTHVDAVSDNFLILSDGTVRLIDWEYAGMCDPHVDIAMFCIYSLYNKRQIDRLIDIYFEKRCSKEIRIKIYCYIAICGLLWSNWCEYKMNLGAELGEYSVHQYRYAKDYYKIVMEELSKDVSGKKGHNYGGWFW